MLSPNRRGDVLLGILIIALTPIAVLIFRPAANLMDFPISEDAYYSLAVARNLSLGNGLSIDGVHWTNGFQPLFTLLCSVFYFLTPPDDLLTPLRMLTALQAFLFVVSAMLFGSILGRLLPASIVVKRSVRLVGTICFLLSDFLFVHAFNGLETGLLFCVVLVTLDQVLRLTENYVTYMRLGVLLGLCFLTRIDTCFLVAAFCLSNLKFGPGPLAQRLASSVIAGAIAVLISLPWLLYSLLAFGSLMPTSGQAYSSLTISGGRLLFAVTQSTSAMIPYLRYPEMLAKHDEAFLVLMVTGLLFLAVIAISTILLNQERTQLGTAERFTPRSLLLVATLTLYCVFLTAYYGLISTAMHFYARYLSMYAFLGVSGIAILLGIVASRSQLARYGVGLLLVLQIIHLHLVHSYMGKSGYYYEAVELVRRHVPTGATVGAEQSGTLGYFRDNVVNLDGKVNQDVLAYPGFPQTLPQYLADNKIDWYVDWAVMPLTPKLLEKGEWVKVDQIGRTVLLRRLN